jgi:ferritin
MQGTRFAQLLGEQIGHEFAASQQYTAIAVWFDARSLKNLAAHFYRQAVEERNHAHILIQFQLDQDLPVRIPGVEAPRTEFVELTEPVALALEQERRVTAQIEDLTRVAREEGVFQGEQAMQWFLSEQVEEVASMSTLLDVCEMGKATPLAIEEWLARNGGTGGDEPGMPKAAGGAL